ncbi:MAG: hypothetical protein GY898_27180 [Proteobacteria bacterium]|nr:hypothetical protein [Pseudomonadota bacterium]
MSDPPKVLEIEEPDPEARRPEELPSRLEDPFELDVSQFKFPEQHDKPFKAGVFLSLFGYLWVLFGVLAMVFFGPMWGPVNATLVGTLMWMLCVGSWAALVGGRAFWMGSHSPIDQLWDDFVRREVPVPDVDEAPAQLLRRRGRSGEALAMYERWAKEHPKLAILVFRMAEIQHHDLKNRAEAARLYRRFVARVRAKGYRPSEEDRANLGIAEGLAEELSSV